MKHSMFVDLLHYFTSCKKIKRIIRIHQVHKNKSFVNSFLKMYKNIIHVNCLIFILAFYVHNAESSKSTSSCPFLPTEPLPYPTPSPIRLNTTTAKPVHPSSPLVIRSGLTGILLLRNTGYAFEFLAYENSPTTSGSYGGVLCGDRYQFRRAQIFFSRTYGRSYDEVDGVSTPLTLVLIYQNKKYPNFEEAMQYRDGLAIEVFRYTFDHITNWAFIPISVIVNILREPGSALYVGPEVLVYAWLDILPLVTHYYSFPGAYTDLETGKSYDCATVFVANGVYPIMTKHQFETSFLNLKSHNGSALETVAPEVYPAGERPIVKAPGVVGQYVII